MDKIKVKIYINILLELRGWDCYYKEIDKDINYKNFYISELRDLRDSVNKSDIDPKKPKRKIVINLFNNIIFKNVKDFNDVFLEFNENNICNDDAITNKDFYKYSIEKLVQFATENNIPIIRFPHIKDRLSVDPLIKESKKGNVNNYLGIKKKYGPFYYDSNEWEKGFIMFVDFPDECSIKNNIGLTNQYINFLAHELGHSMDNKFDGNIIDSTEKSLYIVNREIFAWEKAKEILKKYSIGNTDIDIQSEIKIDKYKNHHLKNINNIL
jgi:hypothetical protein